MPLRRDPPLPVKLACAARVADLVKEWGSRDRVPRLSAEQLERDSGWPWKRQLRQWFEDQVPLSKKMAELKIGVWGLRPFGSPKAQCKRQSKSMGCRLYSSRENYQSSVLRALKAFFEWRRSHGITVTSAVLRDRYMALLRAEATKSKVALHELRAKLQSATLQGEVEECSALIKQFDKNRKLLLSRTSGVGGCR